MESIFRRRPLRLFVVWSVIGWSMVAAVVYLSLTSNPIQTPSISFGDKIGHFGAYFILMIWFAQIYFRASHGVFLTAFILMGVGLEFVQGQTSYRSFEYEDMLADSMGALIAFAVAGRVSGLLVSFERRFVSQS